MGSFSWTRAEGTTQRSNFTDGDRYKILVPIEFGGGYIKDTYYDYGYINNYENAEYIDSEGNEYSNFPLNDLHGIQAYWNGAEGLEYVGSKPITMIDILKRGETCKQSNRTKGIHGGCYDHEIDKLKYPLKLVSASYKGTYEQCEGRSYGDPNQGFYEGFWSHHDYERFYERVRQSY